MQILYQLTVGMRTLGPAAVIIIFIIIITPKRPGQSCSHTQYPTVTWVAGTEGLSPVFLQKTLIYQEGALFFHQSLYHLHYKPISKCKSNICLSFVAVNLLLSVHLFIFVLFFVFFNFIFAFAVGLLPQVLGDLLLTPFLSQFPVSSRAT